MTGVAAAFLAALLGTASSAARAEEAAGDRLADRIVYRSPSPWHLGIDASAQGPGWEPRPLRVGDTTYPAGIGHYAGGEIVVELDGAFRAFEAEVGVQWQDDRDVSARFEVYVDGDMRFDSGALTKHDPAQAVHVPVSGAQELKLAVRGAGQATGYDFANWIGARLVPDPSAGAAPVRATADVAPFARVVTSDAGRLDGARASRTEEFRAEDVFLTEEIRPGDGGIYSVPAVSEAGRCIGLEWAERRYVRELAIEFDGEAPAVDGAQVQFWTGESLWQGHWVTAKTEIESGDGRWHLRLSAGVNPEIANGTEKIRWVFPAGEQPIRVRRLTAHTGSPLDTVRIRVAAADPEAKGQARIEAYNGWLADDSGDAIVRRSWDVAQPLELEVRYCAPRPWNTDRTVLRFELPDAALAVAVDDVRTHECVYVPEAGLFVTTGPTLEEYRARIAGRRSVLDRVRSMPDQTFAQAREKTHNPIQDKGPMMLSLAADNRKFVAYENGEVAFEAYDGVTGPTAESDAQRPYPWTCKVIPRFGPGAPEPVSRRLHGGWFPAPVTTWNDGGILYRQRTFVAPKDDSQVPGAIAGLHEHAVCVIEYTIENTRLDPAEVSLALTHMVNVHVDYPAVLKEGAGGWVGEAPDRLLTFTATEGASALVPTVDGGTLTLAGVLKPEESARVVVYIPAWKVGVEDAASFAAQAPGIERLEAYWTNLFASAMAIDLPDPLLEDVIRASQVHCLMAARNEAGGARVAPWISADRYGPLESEAHSVIRGMDLWGQLDFARRGLEFFIDKYNDAGFLTTGYTTMGTGWHLWTLADHYRRTGDLEWWSRVAPEAARLCDWIVRQRAKTMRSDPRGEKVPEYGLVPPGVAADWNRFAYRFIQEGHFYAGLQKAASALADVGHPEAERFLADAQAFRRDLRRAYDWNEARVPVLPLADGTWCPGYSGMLYCFGRIGDLIPGENASWAYDVELGAHHLAALGVLEPDSPQVTRMANYMEDNDFLRSGWGDYPGERNRADWFNLGGFSKVQPYYTRLAEVYAQRDDVKPFIRSYFNALVSLLSLENLSLWEHFNNFCGWNKTHETGYFLAQSRIMLVMERGEELWLAPFVTNRWLEEGMRVSVSRAPTVFGPVDYVLESHVAEGYIEATIAPPHRRRPEAIVLRLRHPDDATLVAADVTGAASYTVNPDDSTLRLIPAEGPITLRARFAQPEHRAEAEGPPADSRQRR